MDVRYDRVLGPDDFGTISPDHASQMVVQPGNYRLPRADPSLNGKRVLLVAAADVSLYVGDSKVQALKSGQAAQLVYAAGFWHVWLSGASYEAQGGSQRPAMPVHGNPLPAQEPAEKKAAKKVASKAKG